MRADRQTDMLITILRSPAGGKVTSTQTADSSHGESGIFWGRLRAGAAEGSQK